MTWSLQCKSQRAARDAGKALKRRRPTSASGRLRDPAISKSCTTSKRACGSDVARAVHEAIVTIWEFKIHGTFILGLPGETTRNYSRRRSEFAKRDKSAIRSKFPSRRRIRGRSSTIRLCENGWLDAANAELDRRARHPGGGRCTIRTCRTRKCSTGVETFYRRFYFARRNRGDRRRDGASPADEEAAAARGCRVLPVLRERHQQAPEDLIFTADDFGLSDGVNEAVERAHTDGVLTHASLMVAGPAAADAVARARRLPGLRVGLHL